MPSDDEPFVVTTASQSPVDERRRRERRYLITMGVRVIAFVAAIFLVRWSWWLAAIAIALSLLLPWFAVIAANAPTRSRTGGAPTPYDGEQRRELDER
jgi:uncharacterized membrane protein YdbT with pleckstrin-like domain